MKAKRLFAEVYGTYDNEQTVALNICFDGSFYKGLEDFYIHIGSMTMPYTGDAEEVNNFLLEKINDDGGLKRMYDAFCSENTEEEKQTLWKKLDIFWIDDLMMETINEVRGTDGDGN